MAKRRNVKRQRKVKRKGKCSGKRRSSKRKPSGKAVKRQRRKRVQKGGSKPIHDIGKMINTLRFMPSLLPRLYTY